MIWGCKFNETNKTYKKNVVVNNYAALLTLLNSLELNGRIVKGGYLPSTVHNDKTTNAMKTAVHMALFQVASCPGRLPVCYLLSERVGLWRLDGQ